ncbi:MAG: PAC2 family protein [Deltaproteobacteria bacterium]|nr:PAC2 family protein [Deltaproteobacteria bacterium]
MAQSPLRFHVRPSLREPALLLALEGWSDAGEAATTAVRFVAGEIGAAPLAEIDGEEYFDFTVRRPLVQVDEGVASGLTWPDCRFGFATAPGDEPRDLVTCHGVEPHLRWRDWSDHVLHLVGELGIRRVVLLGAFLGEVLYSRPVEVTGVASDPELLAALGVAPVRYAGPTGMIGVLGQRLRERGCQVASLWAGLPHYVELSPNARGALALLERALPFLGVRLDLEPLRRSARDCEERISAMVTGDPELSEYVRELKRREFAQ